MSEKPSLYVVERKEVVILVILFVLVTVLSFTVGVRYGEKIGRKLTHEEVGAQKEREGDSLEKVGGTLGENKVKTAMKAEEAESLTAKTEKTEEKPAVKVEGRVEGKEAPPPAAEKTEKKKEEDGKGALTAETTNAVDASSDAALLSALKDTGVEPPSGKTTGQRLPEELKTPISGSFVAQVGSHPTKREAEEQVRALKSGGVSAQILPAFKDRQGEWFRVVIGGYKSKNEAEKEGKQLKSRGLIRSYFVRRI